MSNYKKANVKYYCELCKVYLVNSPAFISKHNAGASHKMNEAKKGAEVQKEKAEASKAKKEFKKIERIALEKSLEDRKYFSSMDNDSLSSSIRVGGQSKALQPHPLRSLNVPTSVSSMVKKTNQSIYKR